MQDASNSPQVEARTAQVNVRLTPSEKQDVQLVAAFEQATESDTLRNHTLATIRKRAEKIRNIRVA